MLGSATPSLESLARCEEGRALGVRWTRVSMSERPGRAALPTVRVVDMTRQFAQGSRSIFSAPLVDALLRVRDEHRKAVLLLNRRGFANFLMCPSVPTARVPSPTTSAATCWYATAVDATGP